MYLRSRRGHFTAGDRILRDTGREFASYPCAMFTTSRDVATVANVVSNRILPGRHGTGQIGDMSEIADSNIYISRSGFSGTRQSW